MKRVKSYSEFRESRVNEEFIGKLWRKLTGADAKDIKELTDKIISEYNLYNDEGKKEFKWNLETYVNNNRLDDLYKNVINGGEWYGDLSNSLDGKLLLKEPLKIKSNLKDILNYLQSKKDNIKSKVESFRVKEKIEAINKKIDKYNQLVNQLPNFNKDELVQDFEAIIKRIPGCPYTDLNYFGLSLSPTTCFVKYYSVYNRDKEFIKSDAFLRLVNKFNERNNMIKENDLDKLYQEIDTEFKFEDDKLKEYRSELQTKPNNIISYPDYEKAIQWVKEELVGKTVSDVLMSIMNEKKIVVIESSDSKETKVEGDKLVAGNIVYSGQNFNNLNLDNISRFINKEGYKESYSGKGMYVTNNIPYAFYYCYLRFGLEGQKISDTLFPTIYKITLKPGSKFFYKGDTDISDDELKSALICGVSGFHSGNKIVNNQSVEISIFTKDCIEKIEAIKPEDLIKYLDSPQLNQDNKWIERETFKIKESDINWYKGLVSTRIK